MKTYKCHICGKRKTKRAFHHNKHRSSGLASFCKMCARKRPYWHRRKDYFKKYVAGNKEKIRAKWKVAYALKTGKIVKNPCEVCGKTRVEAHHDDYAEPLNVRWLCHKHHMLLTACTQPPHQSKIKNKHKVKKVCEK
jgi:hypothetical protein